MPVGRKKGERKKEKATRSVVQEAVKQLPKRHQKEILFTNKILCYHTVRAKHLERSECALHPTILHCRHFRLCTLLKFYVCIFLVGE